MGVFSRTSRYEDYWSNDKLDILGKLYSKNPEYLERRRQSFNVSSFDAISWTYHGQPNDNGFDTAQKYWPLDRAVPISYYLEETGDEILDAWINNLPRRSFYYSVLRTPVLCNFKKHEDSEKNKKK